MSEYDGFGDIYCRPPWDISVLLSGPDTLPSCPGAMSCPSPLSRAWKATRNGTQPVFPLPNGKCFPKIFQIVPKPENFLFFLLSCRAGNNAVHIEIFHLDSYFIREKLSQQVTCTKNVNFSFRKKKLNGKIGILKFLPKRIWRGPGSHCVPSKQPELPCWPWGCLGPSWLCCVDLGMSP